MPFSAFSLFLAEFILSLYSVGIIRVKGGQLSVFGWLKLPLFTSFPGVIVYKGIVLQENVVFLLTSLFGLVMAHKSLLWFSFLPRGIIGHWSAMGMGAESSEHGQMTCGLAEIALLGTLYSRV